MFNKFLSAAISLTMLLTTLPGLLPFGAATVTATAVETYTVLFIGGSITEGEGSTHHTERPYNSFGIFDGTDYGTLENPNNPPNLRPFQTAGRRWLAGWTADATHSMTFENNGTPQPFLGRFLIDNLYRFVEEVDSQTQVNLINSSIRATGSVEAYMRFERDVLVHNPDLLFIEFTVNDTDREGGRGNHDRVARTMESMVRMAYRHNPNMRIVFVCTSNIYGTRHDAIGVHAMVADYYGIPIVNTRDMLLAHRDANGLITDYLADRTNNLYRYFTNNTHPNDNGHLLYSQFIIERIENDNILDRTADSWVWFENDGATERPPVTGFDPGFDGTRLSGPIFHNPRELISNPATSMHGNWVHQSYNARIGWIDSFFLWPISAGGQGDFIEFTFEGSVIGMFTLYHESNGVLEYNINFGERVGTLNMFHGGHLAEAALYMWYNDLDPGMHNIRITNIGTGGVMIGAFVTDPDSAFTPPSNENDVNIPEPIFKLDLSNAEISGGNLVGISDARDEHRIITHQGTYVPSLSQFTNAQNQVVRYLDFTTQAASSLRVENGLGSVNPISGMASNATASDSYSIAIEMWINTVFPTVGGAFQEMFSLSDANNSSRRTLRAFVDGRSEFDINFRYNDLHGNYAATLVPSTNGANDNRWINLVFSLQWNTAENMWRGNVFINGERTGWNIEDWGMPHIWDDISDFVLNIGGVVAHEPTPISKVAEFRVYNQVLTSDEARELYQIGREHFTLPETGEPDNFSAIYADNTLTITLNNIINFTEFSRPGALMLKRANNHTNVDFTLVSFEGSSNTLVLQLNEPLSSDGEYRLVFYRINDVNGDAMPGSIVFMPSRDMLILESVDFFNQDGILITDLQGVTAVNAEVSFKNDGTESRSFVVLLAVFDVGNRMLGVDFYEIKDLSAGESHTIDENNLTVNLIDTATSETTARLLFWDDFATIAPLVFVDMAGNLSVGH